MKVCRRYIQKAKISAAAKLWIQLDEMFQESKAGSDKEMAGAASHDGKSA